MCDCSQDLEMIQGQLNEIIELMKPLEKDSLARPSIEYQIKFTFNDKSFTHDYSEFGRNSVDVLERFTAFLKDNYLIKNIRDIQISINPLYENENTSNS